ncbi:hypothetical protein [Caldalkalibacillus mannanilyticus]|uniref:hypothetical protein n=1 Tax=Caldalkalibacillus mannanilyticus TaxID=1418 RepID=UPI0006872B4C|nr:hypothetical protein [Caldalkalibacillus mannanilyticus]
MDQNKYLILLKGEDKTSSVASYKIHTSNVEILFKGKFKPHRYHIQNVIIEKNPDIIDIEKKSIYLNEIPIFQVTQVFNFGKKIKIFYQNGESQVFDAESIKFTNKESSDKTGLVERVLRYWTDISQYTKTDDKSEAFLKKEFDKLTFLHPESVLYSYLNKEPVKILSPSTSNIIFPFKFI